MGGEALSDALTALGDTDAAQAALAAAKAAEDNVQSTVSSGSDAISTARQTLQTKFDVKIFQLILSPPPRWPCLCWCSVWLCLSCTEKKIELLRPSLLSMGPFFVGLPGA